MDKHLAAGRGGGSRGRGRKPGFYRGGSSYTVPSSSAPSWRPRRSDHTEPVTGSQAISDPSPSIPEQDIKSEHEFLIGTCPDMCPEKERAQRERLRDLSVFERLNGNPGRTSPSLAVKKVKFHITSHCKLARYSGKSDESSLYYLNMEQLMKCLLSIFDMYDMARRSKGVIKNEAEFRSYYVLLHLGCKIPTMGNSLSSWFCRIPFSILQSEEMCLARTLLRYYRMGDYKQFISTTATRASHLQLCLLEPFLNEVRAQALAYINLCGYKVNPYPLTHLSKLLMIQEQDLESLCSACGLETCIDEAGTKLLPAKQTSFSLPKLGFQSYGLLNRDTC
ncbi:SAC3 family protein C isoform X5 [Dioscorea cayenensis subsp. rotundata]|uniref:SAC3 family protein C isoform X5 n=1 Tax=Dioscorea cayennensis subsp. rotundata TaxID=55577 RepID=A0AB40C939_DIOCR|nr:SAC3 family protein C isoform X5 [Dioscorea cayenensis subsp. rotundata]